MQHGWAGQVRLAGLLLAVAGGGVTRAAAVGKGTATGTGLCSHPSYTRPFTCPTLSVLVDLLMMLRPSPCVPPIESRLPRPRAAATTTLHVSSGSAVLL